DNPYQEAKPFDWFRGYHVGGRSLVWGRLSLRFSDLDFEANAREGISIDWPIRYKDIAPWYDYVERFAGICGQKEGLPHLPDGQFLPPMEMNCVEKHVRERMSTSFSDRILTVSRLANLTVPHNGRGSCQYRDRCIRGCPFGAYFSSNSATLPAAYNSGNLTLRPFSIVNQILFDNTRGIASGVRVIDAETHEVVEYYAKIIFCCASAVASAFILLNSTSTRFPNGFGNDSGELGHNLMDHHFRVGASGRAVGFEDRYYKGRRPNGIYIPRFRNLNKKTEQKDYLRGFGYEGRASRQNWTRGSRELTYFGADLKADLIEPGPWRFGIGAWGECLPYHENRMYLSTRERDKWGQPTAVFDCEWKDNELNMRKDMLQSAVDILESAGMKDINPYDRIGTSAPGSCIHEMGTARMGRDPRTSVLNKWNQVHAAPNVFVTDGACMTSNSCVNPSLTYMALTARAADHAVNELKKGNL
ncbi:MAG: GMC family oxidoreductase, partial [Verrucomicrobiae bacterium]|nr:GMC family oxidoreductase [Verrucomicrobiae bacterium]